MNKQLKHEFRSNLVDIGRRAIEHALRFLPQSNPSCIRRASGELLKLSVSEKWLSGETLTANVFTPCWDAGSFIGRGEEARNEMKWQNENLYPQVEEAFKRLRNAEKNLKAA